MAKKPAKPASEDHTNLAKEAVALRAEREELSKKMRDLKRRACDINSRLLAVEGRIKPRQRRGRGTTVQVIPPPNKE